MIEYVENAVFSFLIGRPQFLNYFMKVFLLKSGVNITESGQMDTLCMRQLKNLFPLIS